jgi:cyclopropane fatty-acyl-phospholipid synthase-like methyltransferase
VPRAGTPAGGSNGVVDRVDYDRQQHDVSAEGRRLPAETVERWMATFARHLRPERPLEVLDRGPGTGRFTPALADAFGGPVHGVEPSARMWAIAEASAPHPAGLQPLALERVRLPMAPDLAGYAARLRLRAVSTFEHLAEEEIVAGFATMDRRLAAGTVPDGPVEADADLLVLGGRTTA